jgi:hypothetical protein
LETRTRACLVPKSAIRLLDGAGSVAKFGDIVETAGITITK